MKQYLDMLRYVLENGVDKMDRTGSERVRFSASRCVLI